LIRKIFTLFFFLAFLSSSVCAQESKTFVWEETTRGLAMGTYRLSSPTDQLIAEVLLVKINPKLFSLTLSKAQSDNLHRAEIKELVQQVDGLMGINANFFDWQGHALGLVKVGDETLSKIHRGGNLLTGVFYLKDSIPKILLREDFDNNKIENTELVFQAGPRLIVNGIPTVSTDKNRRTRRSAIAITKNKQIILLISLNRFPGASFEDVQKILTQPMFEITDALNLDGGGSSQFYFAGLSGKQEFLITGGDKIPIALVFKQLATSSNKQAK
jgi:uncharacterized protein YigE (DUF2233 family)